jgi:hypothetical protein
MRICESALINQHTTPMQNIRVLNDVGETVRELHQYDLLDVEICMSHFELIGVCVHAQ